MSATARTVPAAAEALLPVEEVVAAAREAHAHVGEDGEEAGPGEEYGDGDESRDDWRAVHEAESDDSGTGSASEDDSIRFELDDDLWSEADDDSEASDGGGPGTVLTMATTPGDADDDDGAAPATHAIDVGELGGERVGGTVPEAEDMVAAPGDVPTSPRVGTSGGRRPTLALTLERALALYILTLTFPLYRTMEVARSRLRQVCTRFVQRFENFDGSRPYRMWTAGRKWLIGFVKRRLEHGEDIAATALRTDRYSGTNPSSNDPLPGPPTASPVDREPDDESIGISPPRSRSGGTGRTATRSSEERGRRRHADGGPPAVRRRRDVEDGALMCPDNSARGHVGGTTDPA